MTIRMLGKEVAAAIEADLQAALSQSNLQPGLAVVLVGDDPASQIYVSHKQKACQRLGFHSQMIHLAGDSTQEQLLTVIQELNQDPAIHGILVQMPLPSQIDSEAVLEAIEPAKDVDGFHPLNGGYLLAGHPRLLPCTPAGIMKMLAHYGYDVAGKSAVVIGRSNIVGKPMALLLLQANASVSVLHSRTPDLAAYTRTADLIVVAVGKRNVLTGEMVKDGAVVVDVGMNRLEGKKVVGDVDYDSVAPKCALITPVPGGVGPMTIAMLLANTYQAATQQA
ncbi:MAG: bifunctional methylenetetrahydrofolate dehydrogenase/methenyltetrahydrofolate cyclohydrolase FolD [Candidatus Melainabacteria bacterium HGW-Melainabacteria-1]|nr:MAG: bifunctional methylenetetrahydrofolate dehydrogenase/methenyltetrahydrofolate cyclohydrolase FolD [Candidatus Melainabacteria bacterium HGW-Melainabacteria-1]